jgi:hypothetical protein
MKVQPAAPPRIAATKSERQREAKDSVNTLLD